METPRRVDPEIEIHQDFEREDREDSRSLRWSLLAALVVHALLLTLALPAAEEEGDWQVTACFIPSKEIYARPAATRSEPKMPTPVVSAFCGLTPPREREPKPILEVDVEMDVEPLSLREPLASTGDQGITPQLTACVEPQWIEIARRVCIQGSVILEITIREDGTVADPKILKALPFGLGEQAVKAVAEWRYEPIQVDGKAVAVRHHVVVQYALGESNCPDEIRL